MKFKVSFFIFLICLFEFTQAQKGEKSITAGLLLSFPKQNVIYTDGYLNTGFGIEATGQSNISQNGALLLQASLVGHGYDAYPYKNSDDRLVLFSLKGGYRYQFSTSGIFLNALAGLDIDVLDFYAPLSLAVGAGKRFTVKDVYFIDAGIDYIQSNVANRVNVKAAFSILRRPKPENYKLL